VIIQVDGQLVRSMDDLTSYLEENMIPGQTVNMTVIRGGNTLFVPVVLGIRG
jgi:S1-C subfamily serine protease